MKKGLLIIFSGPSGVGKGTVRNLFIDREELNLAYSISMTTRNQRAGEKNGRDYYFVSEEQFKQFIEEDGFLEYARFVGNYYGTPRAEVERLQMEGKNVLLEIEVQGALQVIDKCPEALSIFIVPPSMEELERRISSRRTEPLEIIQQRLAKAAKEMELMARYKYVICNDDPMLAADLIALIIQRHAQS